jgi:hypothetical protein
MIETARQVIDDAGPIGRSLHPHGISDIARHNGNRFAKLSTRLLFIAHQNAYRLLLLHQFGDSIWASARRKPRGLSPSGEASSASALAFPLFARSERRDS